MTEQTHPDELIALAARERDAAILDQVTRELDGMLRMADASPHHDDRTRHTARVMRDCAVRAVACAHANKENDDAS